MKNITYKVVQWSSPEELYEECLEWTSLLEFIKDEQRFLNELVKKYTIPLIAKQFYESSLSITNDLLEEEKEIEALLDSVHDHINDTEVLLNFDKDMIEVKAYKETHYYLKVAVFEYSERYMETKKLLFDKIKKIIKQENPKRIQE